MSLELDGRELSTKAAAHLGRVLSEPLGVLGPKPKKQQNRQKPWISHHDRPETGTKQLLQKLPTPSSQAHSV